jgi:hypothetical protein
MPAVGTPVTARAVGVADLADFITVMADMIVHLFLPSLPDLGSKIITLDLKKFKNDIDPRSELSYNRRIVSKLPIWKD